MSNEDNFPKDPNRKVIGGMNESLMDGKIHIPADTKDPPASISKFTGEKR
jgi:hypothetical protein